jgi:hypothetical protein
MATKKMAFEGSILYGAAGSTATNVLTNSRDINYNTDTEKGDTTVRGAGSVPIGTARVTRLNLTIEWTMLVKSDDTYLEALRVAAYAGTPVAIRTKDYSAGKGFDGDMILDCQHGKPINGEQTVQFTGTPNDDSRTPQLYV